MPLMSWTMSPPFSVVLTTFVPTVESPGLGAVAPDSADVLLRYVEPLHLIIGHQALGVGRAAHCPAAHEPAGN